MQRQFTELKKCGKLFSQYLDEFTRLSRYAPYIFADEKEKTQRFIDGFHMPLLQYIEPMGIETFTKAVDVATHWERLHPRDQGKNEETSSKNKKQKVKGNGPNPGQGNQGVQQPTKVGPPSPCPRCQGEHWLSKCPSNRPQTEFKCYHCQQPGHTKRNCPQLQFALP